MPRAPRAAARQARARIAPRSAAVYRALADETRREILALLAEGPLPAGGVAASFPDISRPAVSKHLSVLREAGLVVDRAQGRERVYALETTPLADVTAYIAQLDRMWARALADLGKHLDAT